MKYKLRKFIVSTFTVLIFCSLSIAELTDDEILEMLDKALKTLPEKIVKLKPEVRRIATYSLKVDRRNITQPLFRQIQGKIESVFLQLERPILVYTPEVKPLRIVSKEDSITFISGFQSTDEIKKIADKLKLDGFLEGELYLTASTLYLNLRIFASDSMAIVWSEEFTSKAPPQPKLTGMDLGIGGGGMQISGLPGIPSYVHYYTVEARILQKTTKGGKTKFTIGGSIFSIYSGMRPPPVSIVTTGSFSFLAKVGIRVSLIPAMLKEDSPKRDWLATEISFGRIFGQGVPGLTTIGLRIESDITRDFSIGMGISYIPFTDVKIGEGNKVKVGGLSYEISLLRFNFMP